MPENNPQSIANTVGTNLRVWRVRHRVTQAELAGRLRMTQGYVSSVELGHKCLSLKTLERVSNEIGVSIRELISANDR